ncbi:hypothetical protein O181_118280 [Austropuccinia psidii MF-1]|uniref:Retrotransposon gag domain-containing protein n=1 Tax=Austropuccinia psidii MF-1 TaxID=1389203 RepID=A0A9Q3KC06_9BASI|nr:hypothetical protein [Austropuccinia psidii MF-1]
MINFGPSGWLSEEETNLLKNVIFLREKAIAFCEEERGVLKHSYGKPYKVPVISHEPWQRKPIPIPKSILPQFVELVRERIHTGLYEQSTSSYNSPVFCEAKPNGKLRIAHDLQDLIYEGLFISWYLMRFQRAVHKEGFPSVTFPFWQEFPLLRSGRQHDPNEVRKAEQELDNLRMKESGHVSLYIADFRSLISRIGVWEERAYIHVYRRGLASRLLDQLDFHPGAFDTLQELMDVTLELDTRYHERQKEKGGNQEKKPPVTGSNQSRPPQNSSSKRLHQNENKKGKQFQSSKDKPHAALLNKDNKLIGSEKERRIKEGLCTYCGEKHPI